MENHGLLHDHHGRAFRVPGQCYNSTPHRTDDFQHMQDAGTQPDSVPDDSDYIVKRGRHRDADRRPGAGCDGLFIHTAGSLPVDVLPAERRGVLYPLQTFSRARQIDFRQVPLFIESPSDEDFLLAIASQLSLTTWRMDGRRRGLLHLAAVFVCNFTNHMYDLGDHVAREAGVPFEVLLPLIDETARKVHQLSPGNAQTGPAVRLDRNVMERHLELLPGRREKEIYELLSRSIYDRLRLDKD